MTRMQLQIKIKANLIVVSLPLCTSILINNKYFPMEVWYSLTLGTIGSLFQVMEGCLAISLVELTGTQILQLPLHVEEQLHLTISMIIEKIPNLIYLA